MVTKNFRKCVHGGSHDCQKYGGSGAIYHPTGYRHPIAHVVEGGYLAKSVTEGQHAGVVPLLDLEDGFDNDEALKYLQVDLPVDLSKSLYYFDFETKHGIDRLLELLPILDRDVLQEVYTHIWPGYSMDAERWNERIARLEIRGYLLDFVKYFDKEDDE